MKQLSYNQEQDICNTIAEEICEANGYDKDNEDNISEAILEYGIMENIREFLERYQETYLTPNPE